MGPGLHSPWNIGVVDTAKKRMVMRAQALTSGARHGPVLNGIGGAGCYHRINTHPLGPGCSFWPSQDIAASAAFRGADGGSSHARVTGACGLEGRANHARLENLTPRTRSPGLLRDSIRLRSMRWFGSIATRQSSEGLDGPPEEVRHACARLPWRR
jgi:hypothetical protein